MIWLYRTITLPFFLLSAPFYLRRMWRRGGYGKDWQQRLGYFPKLPPKEPARKRIWIQAVSVGEVLALAPLIERLNELNRFEIVLTTTTSTGYREALARFQERVLQVGIFPIDLAPFSKRAWKRIQPDAVILTESELWPEHIQNAQISKSPVFLINARISDTSFKRFQQFSFFSGWIFKHIHVVISSTQQDYERLVALGASPLPKIGNLKVDVPLPSPLSESERKEQLEALGYNPSNDREPFVLIGASTWDQEEALLLSIQKRLIESDLPCFLLLVPRHAERRNALLKILEQQSLEWDFATSTEAEKKPTQIFLADTTGQLTKLLRLADLAFIGKSMPPNQGGQTPIEAAGLGIPTVFGPNMSNFQMIKAQLLQAGASKEVRSEAALYEFVRAFIEDPSKRSKMRAAGLTWHQENQGITDYICEQITHQVS
jgi:3-deoxy-D-manno-octulosonic-acid transferase